MAIFGLALVHLDSKLDFPALGRPIIPASAITFNCNHIQNSSPCLPLVFFLGARFVELLNLVFPKPPSPPVATTNFSLFLVKSYIKVLLSSSYICVPIGTFKIKFSPPAPVLFFLLPDLPFSALKCCLYLKSTNVFRFRSDSKITDPPFPPSPPSGPPNSTYFSLLKLEEPEPPLPALIYIFA